ncbi:MAG: nucleotide sugar dehydrogenase [Chloroflexota bacterium]
MKIIVAGTGFVGVTHAAVISEYGHEVYAYDIDEQKLDAYRSADRNRIGQYVNEAGLPEIIAETRERSLFFTSALEEVIEGVEAIFLCLPTPPNLDGSSNLSFYFQAIEHLCGLLARRNDTRRVVLINKSTVPIGTVRQLEDKLKEYEVPNAGVASNPEFLPEGDAIEQSRRPSRVVVGADHEEDFQIIRRIYSHFVNHVRIRYIETTPETAEAIKYVSNTLLFTYISFWNGVGARLGESLPNIRMEELKLGVTADSRISNWGSYVSNGAGGSCYGKDTLSLIYQLRTLGQSADILRSVYEINEYQKTYLLDRAVHEAGVRFNQKRVALLGLAFKQRTNDMRDSSSLKLVEALLARGVSEIRAYDPMAMDEAKRFFNPDDNHLFQHITYHESSKAALEGSDMLIITTDWPEFRGLSGTILDTVAPPYLVIDGRRMISDFQELAKQGYSYLAVGSRYLSPQ